MKTFVEQLLFNKALQVEVSDQQTNVNDFYNWMQKCGNEYIGDTVRMERAFKLIK